MLAISEDSRFAHRGLHAAGRPANSLSAIAAAAEAGFGIEFDIHLSVDGVPFISHDPDTASDTGVPLTIGATRSETLRGLRFLDGGEPLATLDDVLAAVAPSVPLLVELKTTHRVEDLVDAVAGRVQQRVDAVALQSFDPRIVHATRRRLPDFAVGQLVDSPRSAATLRERCFWATLPSNAWIRPNFMAVQVSALASTAVMFWRNRLQCPLLGWTVVDDVGVEACRAAGAGRIFEGSHH